MAILLTKSLFFDIPFVKLAKKNIDISFFAFGDFSGQKSH
jgi:hypothetical protein